MSSITKDYEISAGHFLPEIMKCNKIHGHNYKISVTAKSKTLDENGMVMDFNILKNSIKTIVKAWDHRFLIAKNHPNLQFEDSNQDKNIMIRNSINNDVYSFPKTNVVLLNIKNTTAELLADCLKSKLMKIHPNFIINVSIAETSSSRASTA